MIQFSCCQDCVFYLDKFRGTKLIKCLGDDIKMKVETLKISLKISFCLCNMNLKLRFGNWSRSAISGRNTIVVSKTGSKARRQGRSTRIRRNVSFPYFLVTFSPATQSDCTTYAEHYLQSCIS